MSNQERTAELTDALLRIDRVKAGELFANLFDQKATFADLEAVVIGALQAIGDGWEAGRFSLAQVYMSGVICEDLMDRYLPQLAVERRTQPRMAIGVLLDQHALGKRIIVAVLRAAGYEVLDFGTGLTPVQLAEKAAAQDVELLLVSALMYNSALQVTQLREELAALGANPRVVVGGAPFRLDTNLWERVGADADGGTASELLQLLERGGAST